MTSQDAITFGIRYIGEICGLRMFDEVFLTFLPLSHIAAQSIDIFVPLFYGITVYFAQPDALKGSLPKTLKEVRPTYIWGVPRVWEKIQEGIIKETKNLAGIKWALFEWAKRVMTDNIVANFHGQRTYSYSYKIAKYLIIDKILIKLDQDDPFLMLKKTPNDGHRTGNLLVGNYRFEGFCADLAEKLSKIVNFTYEFRLVKDNKYGSKGLSLFV
jgi:long-chain-fatty-acid--CoA ligase ACSBG